jgi:tRNA (cmo5U34)-methyltransferase
MESSGKSSIEEIRARFDGDVDRFSNLEKGQSAAMDSPLGLELIATAAFAATPQPKHLLDVGCGAGNYSLRLLQEQPIPEITLIDLSQPMLNRACERISAISGAQLNPIQTDLRSAEVADNSVDVIVAGSVLHHLRTDADWDQAFAKLYAWLRPGGSLWIYDLVSHNIAGIAAMMQRRYGDYLTNLKDTAYRDLVFEYIQVEDTPRPLAYQLQLMQQVGFAKVDVLHFQTCFAVFGGQKA